MPSRDIKTFAIEASILSYGESATIWHSLAKLHPSSPKAPCYSLETLNLTPRNLFAVSVDNDVLLDQSYGDSRQSPANRDNLLDVSGVRDDLIA